MGSGKSTVGRKLSSATGLNFIDLDNYIENREKKTINYIFENKGEDHFRRIEHNYLKEIIKKDNFVLSCGGGTPCFFDNMPGMNEKGVTIYLKMNIDALYSRIIQSQDKRPLVKEISGDALLNYITTLLNKREEYYKMAHHTVEAINLKISSVVKLIG